MGVSSLLKTVNRQRRGCDLNPGPTAPESSTLTTRLTSHPSSVFRHIIFLVKLVCVSCLLRRSGALLCWRRATAPPGVTPLPHAPAGTPAPSDATARTVLVADMESRAVAPPWRTQPKPTVVARVFIRISHRFSGDLIVRRLSVKTPPPARIPKRSQDKTTPWS